MVVRNIFCEAIMFMKETCISKCLRTKGLTKRKDREGNVYSKMLYERNIYGSKFCKIMLH
jgi:hypothetical protein